MSNNKHKEEAEGPGISIADIYFVLFRQKWIIISFFILGLIAAGALCIIKPARWESEAKVYVEYIRQSVSRTDPGNDNVFSTADNANSAITTELELLTSLDLANQVVANIGATRILAAYGGGSDTNVAAAVIVKELVPDPQPKGSIVRVVFQHPDPDMAQKILLGVLDAYLVRSADTHSPGKMSPEYYARESERLRTDLAATEGDLNEVKAKAGIISTLEESKKDWDASTAGIGTQLLNVETELAGLRARVGDSAKSGSTNAETPAPGTNVDAAVPSDVLSEFRITCNVLETAKTEYERARAQFPPESPMLDSYKRRVEQNTEAKKKLEVLYPGLKNVIVAPSAVATSATGAPMLDVGSRITELVAQTNLLNQRLLTVRKQRSDAELLEPRYNELLRLKQAKERNLNGFLESVTRKQVEGSGQYSGGIKITEQPIPPSKKRSKSFKKLLAMAVAGSVGGGLALAFLLEFIFDRSVRRPTDVEKKLKLPLFITIPDMNRNGHRKSARLAAVSERRMLTDTNGDAIVPYENGNGHADGASMDEIPPWDPRHPLHRFYSGLRDRVIVNFEIRNLNHNPKLVAVTSCGRRAGVSTIAAGLAASLSDTGDGNVLLVDMNGKNGEEGAAQRFYKGTPGCGLDDALESDTKSNAFVQENLYVATEPTENGNMPRTIPRRFASLMPKLKTSDYDYIIFDMPPVSQTSVTPRLSGLMDMVLLVIESEKTNKEIVERATALLNESKASVSTVLNKVRTYVPGQLHREVLDDE